MEESQDKLSKPASIIIKSSEINDYDSNEKGQFKLPVIDYEAAKSEEGGEPGDKYAQGGYH